VQNKGGKMLIILSQDKGTLEPYNGININYNIEHKWTIESKEYVLGQYDSKERCEEIIQEIIDVLEETCGGITMPRIYKMPKK
jgi:hypothetical protein